MTSHAKRCCARIDLGALERNLGRIRAALPNDIRYISVVKADAYGHGVRPMTTRLMQSAADAYAVANVEEGAVIRDIGSGWPVLVLGALLPEEMRGLFEYDLQATISSLDEVRQLESIAKKQLDVHLKIDTGMGRLGVWHEQALELYEKIEEAKHLNLCGLYTHFSSADTDPDFTRYQRSIFLDIIKQLPEDRIKQMHIHADNSAGIETFTPGGLFNAVRIGLLQFGYPPAPGSLLQSLKTEPVLTFEGRVALVKALPKGTPISYSATHTLSRDSQIAILAAGYADGLPTTLSNKGEVAIKGRRAPIIGRVTMDQTIVDVTNIPGVSVGDTAVFFGGKGNDCISIKEFASWSSRIPWEAFCSISKRVPRIYEGERSI